MDGVEWAGCEVVERVPGKVSGRPVVRGTRVLAEAIVQDADLGSDMEELRENYPTVSDENMAALLQFARSQRFQTQR